MKRDIISQIKKLKSVEPDSNWLQAQRSALLLEASQSDKLTKKTYSRNRSWRLSGFFNFNFSRVVVSFLFLSLMFSGGFLAAGVAENSLAGDLFYPIKLAVEKVKIKISDQGSKSKLRAEFIGIRTQEISDLTEDEESLSGNKDKITKTVDVLQGQVSSTRRGLNEIKEAKPTEGIKLADMLVEQTVKSEEVLTKVKKKLAQADRTEDSSDLIDKIDALTEETSTLAVEAKEVKAGIEVEMEVKQTDPEAEEKMIITSPVKPLIKEASKSFEETLEAK